jgi:hypothetical protein
MPKQPVPEFDGTVLRCPVTTVAKTTDVGAIGARYWESNVTCFGCSLDRSNDGRLYETSGRRRDMTCDGLFTLTSPTVTEDCLLALFVHPSSLTEGAKVPADILVLLQGF